MKYPSLLWTSILLLFSSWCQGAATDNLWLCPDGSGVDNVVSATSAPEGCQKYSAERIKSKSIQQPKPNKKGTLTVADTPPAGVLPAIPAPLDFSRIAYAPLTETPQIWHRPQPNSQPIYRDDATKIYLCTIDGKQQIVEDQTQPADSCTLMGAKGRELTSLISETAEIAQPNDDPLSSLSEIIILNDAQQEKTIDSTVNTVSSTLNSDDEKIYLCQDSQGNQSILQGKTPPAENCQLMGIKSEADHTTPTTSTASAQYTEHTTGKEKSKTTITTTQSGPGDIYMCYDAQGKPSFVNENARGNYQRCRFFSRSFASVNQALRNNNPLHAQSTPPSTDNGLRCTGAGQVIINGEIHTYNCATRSYDHTPGSSGGEVQLGNRRAIIPAYHQDYLNTSGSCGGTITSANGRVLHLEPTKDCPEAMQIVAREIARTVRAGLNISVNGAFLERQRGLSAQINRIAREIGVDPYLVHAVISAESAYKSRAVSHAGARGLMQLMPATARRFNVHDSFHTGQNIRGGTTYLKWLLEKFNGNMELAIAGYNAGEGNVIKYGYKIPPFIETKAYVPKVMQYYHRYRSNPELIGL